MQPVERDLLVAQQVEVPQLLTGVLRASETGLQGYFAHKNKAYRGTCLIINRLTGYFALKKQPPLLERECSPSSVISLFPSR